MIKKYFLFVMCVVFFNFFTANSKEAHDLNDVISKDQIKKFINLMHKKHKFNKEHLQILFKEYKPNQYVLEKISNPTEKLSWDKYKTLLLSPKRIEEGKNFLNQHRDALLKAEQQFGVPKEIILSILGIESFYGKILGNIKVIESLATLAFDYPPRKKFFTQELEEFLLLTKQENLDPNIMVGSYAGAMGPPQFIPSSYREYAIDFADINSKDLNNITNAIGSVANYLCKSGWKRNQPIADPVNCSIDIIKYSKYIDRNLAMPTLSYSLEEFKEIGLKPFDKNNAIFADLKRSASLLEFILEKNNKEYWLVYNNFRVITKYNHSVNYAMVVYSLAANLKS